MKSTQVYSTHHPLVDEHRFEFLPEERCYFGGPRENLYRNLVLPMVAIVLRSWNRDYRHESFRGKS